MNRNKELYMLTYTFHAEGATAFPMAIRPDAMLAAVKTWDVKYGADFEQKYWNDLLGYLQFEYPRFVPRWLRICSAVARRPDIAKHLDHTTDVRDCDTLATIINKEAEAYAEKCFGPTGELQKVDAIREITRILQHDRRNILTYSAPILLLENMCALRDGIGEDFESEISIVDRSNHIMRSNGLDSLPEDATEEVEKYLRSRRTIYVDSLPRWTRQIIEFARKNRLDLSTPEARLKLIVESHNPILTGRRIEEGMEALSDLYDEDPDIFAW